MIEIRPLPNYPIVKDLVTDQGRMIDAHTRLKPYIIRAGTPPEAIEGEFHQTEEELVRYLQFSYCLKCGLCMSASPTGVRCGSSRDRSRWARCCGTCTTPATRGSPSG